MVNRFSIARIKSLADSHQNPLLALKTYTVFILNRLSENDDLPYLVDHVLHCNVFALHAKQQIECVRDYARIALDLLLSVLRIELENDQFDVKTVELIASSIQEGKLEGSRIEVLVLLYITLNNWACCEIQSGNSTLGYSLFRLCLIVCELVKRNTTLLETANLNLITVNNECVHQLMMCNFPEVEQLIVETLGLSSNAEYLLPSGHLPIPEVQNLLVSGQSYETTLLKGLVCYVMAIAQEFQRCEEAGEWYTVATEVLESLTTDITAFDDLPNALKAVLSAKDKLSNYVQETKQKLFEELEGKPENSTRRRRKAPSGSRIGLRRRKRTTTQFSKSLITVSAPAITANLRSSIRRDGLSTTVLELLSVKTLFAILCPDFAAGVNSRVDAFVSPLYDCMLSGGRVVGVLLCTETPVQRAIKQEKMLLQGVRRSNSVWVLRSRAPDQSEGPELNDIPHKLIDLQSTKAFPKLTLTRPPSLSAIEKSCTQLGAVTKLLDKRLNALLKCERAFDDQWSATEMIKKALVAFYVPQELLKIKAEMLINQRIRTLREERSAQILKAFFRRVLHAKKQPHSKTGEWYRKSRENGAAITLQSYVRRWIAVRRWKEFEIQKGRTIHEIIRAQSLFRGKKARMMYPGLLMEKQIAKSAARKLATMHFASTQIQRVYRGHSTRLAVWRYLSMNHYATLHHLFDSRKYYATLIQKRVRGMLVRKKYGKEVHAKRCSGRNKYRAALLERSCIVIQRCFRRYRARCRIIDLSHSRSSSRWKGTPVVNHPDDCQIEEETQRRFYAAAIAIQRLWRLHQVRKRVREMMERRRLGNLSRQKEMYKPFLIDEWIF